MLLKNQVENDDQHCGTDRNLLPNIFVTQRSMSIGSPVAVQKFPLGPEGAEIKLKKEEWTFKDDGNLQVLNTQYMNIPCDKEMLEEKLGSSGEIKFGKGNFLNLSEEVYEMIELSQKSGSVRSQCDESVSCLSDRMSPPKEKKKVTFGGLSRNKTMGDNPQSNLSLDIVEDLPETFDRGQEV